jgi:hypothetical protein
LAQIASFFTAQTPLYDALSHELEVTNPFKVNGQFVVQYTQERVRIEKEEKYGLSKPSNMYDILEDMFCDLSPWFIILVVVSWTGFF